MNINTFGRQVEVTQDLKDLFAKKLGKLDKFFRDDADCNITLRERKNGRKVLEVTITATGPAANAAPVPVKQGTIPVNSADAALLDTLPGIGKVYAQAIIDERMAYGPYFYPEDVMDVKGIGVKRLEAIYDMLDLSPSE